MAALSPMMQQYFEIKKQHPDKLLFFRLGDFYEMFYDDAIVASKELELTLTGRDCGQAERAPMCGVPFHSYENYVARLIEKGYKVAICEQMEDPALAKGLVKRDVVRVVTPGTVIEQSMLQDDRNNFIASILIENGQAGLCFADVSTGEAHVTCISGQDLGAQMISELCRYAPSEVLFNPVILDYKDVTAYIKQQLTCAVELLEDSDFEPQACKVLRRVLRCRRLRGGRASGAGAGRAAFLSGGHAEERRGAPEKRACLRGGTVHAPVARYARQSGADTDDARA